MAISFVAAGTVGTGTNPTAGVPAGIQKDDLLLILTTGSATPTTPSGWTQLNAQGAGQFLTILFKFATASESSVTLTQTGASSKAVMVAYRGAGGVEVRPAFTTGTGTTATPNTVTTTYSNDYVISLYACAIGTTTWTANGSTTSRVNSAATSTITGLLIADELKAATGASTARAATLSVSRAWSAFTIAIIEAPRALYWVGGNGTWDASTTTNWANSSGGTGGVVAPTLVDDVFVDGSSGSPTITLSGSPVCESLTTTGATCTLSSTGALTVNGSMTLSSTTTWSNTGKLTFVGTGTVTTNTVSIASAIDINALSQTLTLGSALTTTGVLALLTGTLTLNGFDANCLTFNTSTTGVRGINFGSNFVNITSTATGTVLQLATATNFTPTGTGGFKLTGAASGVTRTISVGTTAGGAVATAPNLFVAAGSDNVSFTAGNWIGDLDFTGFTGTATLLGTFNIAGSFKLVSGMTWSGGGGIVYFRAISSGKTITSAGKTLGNSVYFIGVGGSWALQDALNASFGFTISDGTFDANNQNITTDIYVLSGGAVTMGSGTWTASGTGSVWTATGTTITPNTSTIALSTTTATALTFAGGGKTYNNLSLTGAAGTGTLTITGANTFNTLSSSRTGNYTITFPASTTTTVSTWSISGSNAATNAVTINSSTSGTQATLSVASGTVNPNYARIQDSNATGGATFTATSASNLGNNTGWTFSTARYWVGGNGNWDTTTPTNWSNTSGGAGGEFPPSLFEDAIIDANSGSPTITLTALPSTCKSLNTTGATCSIGGPSGQLRVNGDFTITNSTTWTTSGTLTFTGSGTVSSTAGSVINIAANVAVNAPSQTVVFANIFTTLNTATSVYNRFTLDAGTIQLNNNLVARDFTSNNANVRSVAFNGGTIRLLGTGAGSTFWSCANATNFSTTGTPTVRLITATGTTRTFTHGTTGGSETTGRIDLIIEGGASDTATITSGSHLRNLDIQSNGTYGATGTLNLYGSLTVSSGLGNWNGGTGTTINFVSTSAGNTIQVNGQTTTSNFVFNGVGGSWSLADAINLGAADITVTNGTFSTNNQNITCGSFASNNSNIRTVNLGSSTISLSDSGTTVWNFATTTNLTFNAGTSQINLTSTTSPTFVGGGLTYNNLQFVGDSSITISGSNTFNTISCTATTSNIGDLTLTSGTTQTVTNFNVDGSSVTNYITIDCTSTTVPATLSKASGTVSVANARINAVAATGGATWNAFTCQKRSALATGWNFNHNRYLVGAGAANFITENRWSTTSGGASNSQPPYQFDTVLCDANSGAVTISMSSTLIGGLDTTGFTGTFATANVTLTFYGSIYIDSGTTISNASSLGVFRFQTNGSPSTITILPNSGFIDVDYDFYEGTWSFGSNLRAQSILFGAPLGSATITINFGSYTFQSDGVFSDSASSATSTQILNLQSATINLPSSAATVLVLVQPGTTVNGGTSTINLAGSTTSNFNSDKTFNNVVLSNAAATGTVTFVNSPTIQKLSSLRTGAYTIALTAASTTTIGTFDVRGTAGNIVTVQSTTTTNATLASLSGAIQSNIDYLTMNYITATPAVSATGATPYYWYIGSNSTTNVNTTGVIALPGTYRAYHLTSGTSWSVPANWNNSSNNVYLLGGGGGGSGSVVASSTGNHVSGAGGGGGGFTTLTNVSLTPSGTAAYAIGAAGSAGAGSTTSSTGGNGGTTTFIVTNTAGGGGGGSGTTTASTAGTAGTGTTFNGGAGGAGTAAGNVSNAGAGGGGPGGLQAAGVNGGNNSSTTAGTGGAGNGGGSNPIALLYSDIKYGTGGNGGGTTAVGVVGTIYGSGGGGGGTAASSATTRAGATGTQGAILIAYQPAVVTTTSGNFLTFFYQ